MAQNSDTLQEPSMDELLASIREIIEENTGIPSQEGNNVAYGSHTAQAVNRAPGQNRNYDTMASNFKQDIRVRTDKAAAPANRQMPSNFPQNNAVPQQRGRTNIMPQNGFHNPQQNQNGGYNGGRQTPEAHNTRAPNGGAPGNRPQDSMNALAERIGLYRNGNPVVHDSGQNELAEQAQSAHIPPMPSAGAGQIQGNFAVNNSDGRQNGDMSGDMSFVRANNVCSYERHNGRQAENGRPHFNPAAMSNNYRDGEDLQMRERGADSEFEENNRQMPQQAQHISSPQREKGKSEHRQSRENLHTAEFHKNSPADVERSAENLLRPFIAEWLDEHFRDLFEKILREEVQRFIQSMRRG